MAALPADVRRDFQRFQINANDGIERIDERQGVGSGRHRGPRRYHNIRNIWREFHDHRNLCDFHHPTRDLLAILWNLANSAAHAALTHAVRTSVVQFDSIGAGILNAVNHVVPGLRLGLHHRRGNDSAVWPRAFYFGDFAKIYFQRTVGDQLNVVNGQHFLAAVVPRSVAIGNIQHRWADCFPDRATPACFKSAMHLHAGIARWRRGQPKRIRRTNPGEIDAEVSHVAPAFRESIARQVCRLGQPLQSRRRPARGSNLLRHKHPGYLFQSPQSLG